MYTYSENLKTDSLSYEGVYKRLSQGSKESLLLMVEQKVSSTNTYLKNNLALYTDTSYTALVAGEQSQGRGRRGKVFFSPPECGIYLSIMHRESNPINAPSAIVARAALSVCYALQKICTLEPQIKWVNDIYLEQKKVCGVLVEVQPEALSTNYAVITGIGLNVYKPEEGYPIDLREKVTSVSQRFRPQLRNRLAAAIIENYISLQDCSKKKIIEQYRSYSMLDGEYVVIEHEGMENRTAKVLGINDDLSLRVQYEDLSTMDINSTDISVHLQ